VSATKLFDAVGLSPALPGARCRGRHHLFDPPSANADPDDAAYAEQAALRLCAGCPALASCSRWFESLPKQQRPPGVVAGRVNLAPRPGRSKATGGANVTA
jgi:hypothetical protein